MTADEHAAWSRGVGQQPMRAHDMSEMTGPTERIASEYIAKLEADAEQGGNDYLALMDRHDALFVRNAALEARVRELEALVSSAYHEGYEDGADANEHDEDTGSGETWLSSRTRAAIYGTEPPECPDKDLPTAADVRGILKPNAWPDPACSECGSFDGCRCGLYETPRRPYYWKADGAHDLINENAPLYSERVNEVRSDPTAIMSLPDPGRLNEVPRNVRHLEGTGLPQMMAQAAEIRPSIPSGIFSGLDTRPQGVW